MSKIVYLFDELDGNQYAGIYEAQESPLEPGEYIAPVASTDIEPLPFKAGFAICFNNGTWEYRADNRGIWFKPGREVVEVHKFDDVIDVSWTREPLPKTIAELILEKRQSINAEFEKSMQQITNGYPANEVSSWSKQEAEARAYAADSSAITPLIDALSSARGVAKAEMVLRIIAKADLFAIVSGQLIGKRQSLEDALDALPETTTAQDIAAIVW